MTLRHIGIPVKNLEKATEWYKKLGFSTQIYSQEQWKRKIQVAKLRAPDDTVMLELIEGVWQPHVAIAVESIDAWGNLVEFSKGDAYYVRDPDGNYVELVEVRE